MKQIEKIVEGTGAIMEIPLGFIPDAVEITNVVTRTRLIYSVNDTENSKGIAITAAGASSKASAGVTLSVTDDNYRGFSLKAAAAVNVNGNDMLVKATMFDYS